MLVSSGGEVEQWIQVAIILPHQHLWLVPDANLTPTQSVDQFWFSDPPLRSPPSAVSTCLYLQCNLALADGHITHGLSTVNKFDPSQGRMWKAIIGRSLDNYVEQYSCGMD